MHTQNKLSRRDAIKTMGTGSAALLFANSAQAKTKLSQPVSHKKVKIIIAGGTSLDILFLGNDIFRGKGSFGTYNVVKNVEFLFAKPGTMLFPFAKFNTIIEEKIKNEKNITPLYKHQLKAVDAKNKIATFLSNNKEIKIAYDFLHIVPPMQAPKVFRNSPLAVKEGKYKGYMNVDAQTLRHKEYKNVFGIGDILGIPLGKTGGSAQAQAIIIQDNLAALIENKPLPMHYNGYTVSPIKTKFGEVLLAEFNEKEALPTFWINPYKPRWIWWELDLHVVRKAYFSLMMRGMM